MGVIIAKTILWPSYRSHAKGGTSPDLGEACYYYARDRAEQRLGSTARVFTCIPGHWNSGAYWSGDSLWAACGIVGSGVIVHFVITPW